MRIALDPDELATGARRLHVAAGDSRIDASRLGSLGTPSMPPHVYGRLAETVGSARRAVATIAAQLDSEAEDLTRRAVLAELAGGDPSAGELLRVLGESGILAVAPGMAAGLTERSLVGALRVINDMHFADAASSTFDALDRFLRSDRPVRSWLGFEPAAKDLERGKAWVSRWGRVAGRASTVLGFGFDFYDQYERDGARYHGDERLLRAASHAGVSTAGGYVVGTALAVGGAFVGGPVGAALGGVVGNAIGNAAGGWLADHTTHGEQIGVALGLALPGVGPIVGALAGEQFERHWSDASHVAQHTEQAVGGAERAVTHFFHF